MTRGIYLITCIPTGKQYVGSTKDVDVRWKDHKKRLRGGYHPNARFQRSWDKYGESEFDIETLEIVDDDVDILARELYWIGALKPYLNMILMPGQYPTRSYRPTDRHKKRIGNALKGWFSRMTPEEQAAYRLSNSEGQKYSKRIRKYPAKGFIFKGPKRKYEPTEETKQKNREGAIRQHARTADARAAKRAAWELGRADREMARREKVAAWHRGRPLTEEHKAKTRAANARQFADPELREKHRLAVVVANANPETKAKQRAAKLGKKQTDEHKAKVAAAGRGKTRSEETKARMAETRRLWWAARKAAKAQK